MKCTIVIDPTREEEVVIYVRQKTPLAEQIKLLTEESSAALVGYQGQQIVSLLPGDVTCFFTESGKLFALTEKETWQLRQRLYEIEALLGTDFIKINQSCIANVKKIDRFEVSIGGALRVIFKNGHKDFVSRRQLKFVKERMGFRL